MTYLALRVAQRFASRTIQFDKQEVRQSVAKLFERGLNKLERATWKGKSIGSHDTIDGVTLTILDVRKVKKDITIYLGSRVSRGPRPTAGGTFSNDPHYDNAGTIYLYLNAEWTVEALTSERYDAQAMLESMALHEVTHALDVINEKQEYQGAGGSTKAEQGAYFNHPAEVRAYAKQVVEEAIRKMRVLKLEARRSRIPVPKGHKLIQELLDSSSSWLKIEQHLTRSNANLIYKIVARELQDAGFGEDL